MAHKQVEIGIGDLLRIEIPAHDGYVFFHTAAPMPIQLWKLFYEMITARDIMSTELITLAPETDFASAARIMLDNHINGAPVVDSDRF